MTVAMVVKHVPFVQWSDLWSLGSGSNERGALSETPGETTTSFTSTKAENYAPGVIAYLGKTVVLARGKQYTLP